MEFTGMNLTSYIPTFYKSLRLHHVHILRHLHKFRIELDRSLAFATDNESESGVHLADNNYDKLPSLQAIWTSASLALVY